MCYIVLNSSRHWIKTCRELVMDITKVFPIFLLFVVEPACFCCSSAIQSPAEELVQGVENLTKQNYHRSLLHSPVVLELLYKSSITVVLIFSTAEPPLMECCSIIVLRKIKKDTKKTWKNVLLVYYILQWIPLYHHLDLDFQYNSVKKVKDYKRHHLPSAQPQHKLWQMLVTDTYL